MLKKIAEWVGANPDEVVVKPNMEFGDPNLKVEDLDKLMDARTKGFPISKRSLHQLAVERRLTKMEYEAEMELIKEEDAEMPRTGQGATNLTADEQLAEQEANRTAAAEAAEAKNKAAGGNADE
jgi:hypothetical protein